MVRAAGDRAARSSAASPQAQAAIAALGSVIGASAVSPGSPWATWDPSQPARCGAARCRPAIDAIRALDPGFELEIFLQRAEMTFFLVKRGMQKNDAAAVRPYLNDARVQRRVAAASRSPRRSIGMRCWRA